MKNGHSGKKPFYAKWEEDKHRDEERWEKWQEDDKMYWEKEFEKDRHNLKKEEDKLKKMEEKLKQVKLKHEKRKQEKKKQKIREEEKKRQQERLKWKKQEDEKRRKAEEIKQRQQDDERQITDQIKQKQLNKERRIQIDDLKQWKLEFDERLGPSTKKTNTDCCERRGCDEELDIKFMHHTDKQSGNQYNYKKQVSDQRLDDKDETETCKSKQQIKVCEKAKRKEPCKVTESSHQAYRIDLEDMNHLTEDACAEQNIIQDTEDTKAINKPSEQSTEHNIRLGMNQLIECVKVKDEQEIKSELDDHKLKQTVITKEWETELASYDNKMIINEKHNEVTDNQTKYENKMIETEMQHNEETQEYTECETRDMQPDQNLTEHGNKETQTCNDENDSTDKTRDDTYEFAAAEVNIEETLMNNEDDDAKTQDDDLEMMIVSTSDTMPDENTQMETNSNDVANKEQVIIPKLIRKHIPNIPKGGKVKQGNQHVKIQRKMKSKYKDSKEKISG